MKGNAAQVAAVLPAQLGTPCSGARHRFFFCLVLLIARRFVSLLSPLVKRCPVIWKLGIGETTPCDAALHTHSWAAWPVGRPTNITSSPPQTSHTIPQQTQSLYQHHTHLPPHPPPPTPHQHHTHTTHTHTSTNTTHTPLHTHTSMNTTHTPHTHPTTLQCASCRSQAAP